MNYMKAHARQVNGGQPDLSPLLGTWANTNSETESIVSVSIGESNGGLTIRVYGADGPEPVDWGEAEATVFVSGSSRVVAGFHTRYDFGPVETTLAGNYKLGILVIQSYTTFKDGSERMNHFDREFFHK